MGTGLTTWLVWKRAEYEPAWDRGPDPNVFDQVEPITGAEQDLDYDR